MASDTSTRRAAELRARLAALRAVVSEELGAALDELFELAERGEARRRAEPAPIDAAAEPATAEPDAFERPLHARLSALLAERDAPMRVRELVAALTASGWRTQSPEPGKVVSACLCGRGEFVQVSRGEWALARAAHQMSSESEPASTATSAIEPASTTPMETEPASTTPIEIEPAATEPSEAPASLRSILRDALRARGSAMSVAELVDAARERGWSTTSPRPRDVVSAVLVGLTGRREFVAVARGVYALRDASEAPAPRPVPDPEPVPEPEPRSEIRATQPEPLPPPRSEARELRSTPPAPAEVPHGARQALEFLVRHVADARPDTATLAPQILRLQITAWIAHARALRDGAGGEHDVERATGRVAADLGELCKLWWPGSVEALKLDARPAGVAASFALAHDGGAPLTWAGLAALLDERLADAWSEPGFDDGWADGAWLCADERFVEARLAAAEAILRRIGSAPSEPPPRRASDLTVGAAEMSELVAAARGVRWVRGVVTDGERWGRIAGRLRFLAANHPQLVRSSLPQILDSSYRPVSSGWGFDAVVRAERQDALLRELERGAALVPWLLRAIDAFDTPDLAARLASRREELGAIDLGALPSRRARGRIRKLVTSLGLAAIETPSARPSSEAPLTDALEEEAGVDAFASVRDALAARLGGNRALFISNREDNTLQSKIARAFGLDVAWCVAHPRRASAAADAIRQGRYDVVLSATGFQDHSMDALFARAARDAETLYVRVNRGRPAACARAIARELGLRDAA